jgi:3-dehydroquinate synthase
MVQNIQISRDLSADIARILTNISYDKLFVLTDKTTNALCLPHLQKVEQLHSAYPIVIEADDTNKTLEALACVWLELSKNDASRKSLLINLGGGMVTDLGGFAAATFKRGIQYINIPTTVLGAVDAAVGGKTGINFNGLKNEIGAFSPSHTVLLYSEFFKTLDLPNILSGYAEMLKHGILNSDEDFNKLLAFSFSSIDYDLLTQLAGESVLVKERIVIEDPYEHGIRKALNLGHTVGHAFESLSFEQNRPVPHGYAVAWGMVCELYLSHKIVGFPYDKLKQIVSFVKANYGAYFFTCKEYDRLFELMMHDKKNESGVINFTLMAEIGDIRINQQASKELIFEALDFYAECFGL